MMNRFLTLAFLLFAIAAHSQQSADEKPEIKPFSAIPQIRLYGFYPVHFGDQQFADGYQAQPGFGFNISPLRYKDLRLNLGFERVVYKVEDHSRIANPVSRSTYQSLFAEIQYTIGREDGFCVKPSIGAGVSMLYFKTGPHERFGNQSASDLRAGLTSDWAIFKHLSLFLTAHYVRSNIDVDTAADLHDYYSKANSIQLGMGIVIR